MDKKVLIILKKERAHNFIRIKSDKTDPWFINIVTCKNRNDEIKSSETIIAKDLETRLIHFEHMGWKVDK